ncbi:MAG: response regulator [Gammaproteobacteria bacterium]
MSRETANSGGALNDLSVLVVEDEAIVSLLVESMLMDLGCDDVRYASSVDEAFELLDERTPDTAVLDVNLSGETVYPVARRLDDAGVPFVFATGYGAGGLHEAWAGRPVLQKPFRCDELGRALATVLGAKSPTHVNR